MDSHQVLASADKVLAEAFALSGMSLEAILGFAPQTKSVEVRISGSDYTSDRQSDQTYRTSSHCSNCASTSTKLSVCQAELAAYVEELESMKRVERSSDVMQALYNEAINSKRVAIALAAKSMQKS